jgi:hypothetical protein
MSGFDGGFWVSRVVARRRDEKRARRNVVLSQPRLHRWNVRAQCAVTDDGVGENRNKWGSRTRGTHSP